MIKEIDITYGLPASGKTRWSRSQSKGNGYLYSGTYHIEIDNYLYSYDYDDGKVVKVNKSDFKKAIKKSIRDYFDSRKDYEGKERLIIDGLFTTNDSLVEIIQMVKSMKTIYNKIDKFRIIQFHGDIETCLWNDKGRYDRFGEDKNTKSSIKNLPLEKLNWELLKSLHRNMDIMDVSVHKKPLIKTFLYENYSDYSNDKIVSEEWNIGGTWGDCWGNSGRIEEEPEPVIPELKNLLEKCNASHLYDDIITNLAIKEDGSESDYYGGCSHYSWYEISIDSIENFLKERGYLRNLLITDLVD